MLIWIALYQILTLSDQMCSIEKWMVFIVWLSIFFLKGVFYVLHPSYYHAYLGSISSKTYARSDCLRFDQSNKPDCENHIDPVMKHPVFVEHSTSKPI